MHSCGCSDRVVAIVEVVVAVLVVVAAAVAVAAAAAAVGAAAVGAAAEGGVVVVVAVVVVVVVAVVPNQHHFKMQTNKDAYELNQQAATRIWNINFSRFFQVRQNGWELELSMESLGLSHVQTHTHMCISLYSHTFFVALK